MIIKIIGFSALLVISFGSVVPFTVFAQQTNPSSPITGADGGIGSSDPSKQGFQLVTCSGVDDPRTSEKEIECTYEQLILTARRIIQFVLYIMTPLIVGMIVYTGFKYVTAGGDTGKLADAKRMFTPIIIGLILIFTAWLLVYTILDKLLAPMIGDIDKGSIVPSSIRQ